MLSRTRSWRGFTLVEMVVVVALMAIFLAIALPAFRQLIMNFQVRVLAESVVNGLQLARGTAVQRNENVRFELTQNAGSFTLGWVVKLDDGTVIQAKDTGEAAPYLLIGTLPNNSTAVTFNGLGRVAPNNPVSDSVNTIDVDIPTSIMPASESWDLRIRVLPGGLIRMCDPNVTEVTDVRFCP